MLDVRGNCSILRRSCVTQPFVWRGSTRVLRRSFAGSSPRGLAGPFHQAMWPNCVARVHAGPRRSEREGVESRVGGVRGNLRRV